MSTDEKDVVERLRAPEPRVRNMVWRDYEDGHTEGPFDPIKLEAATTITALQEHIKELEGERDIAHDMLLLADRFKVGEKHGHPVWVISRGPNSWAIWDGAFVLNSDGDWECEPLPSNRDEDFIARTRWAFSDALLRARSTLKDSGNGSEVAR